MGLFLYLPGLEANQLAHGRAVITPTPAADALFPVDRLYDGRLDRAFRFGSTAASYVVKIETGRILNGNLDAWTSQTPDNWTKVIRAGNPTIVKTTVGAEVRSGSAAKYSGDSGDDDAAIIQDFDVVAGEPLRIDGWMRGDGSLSARTRLMNRQTGKYLQPAGTWGSATDLFTRSGTSYQNKVLSFNVETFAASQLRDMTLRLINHAQGSGTAFWDDWFVFPRINFFAVLGHNINAGWTAEVKDSALSLVDTMTIKRRAFFRQLSSESVRSIHNVVLTPPSDTELENFAPSLTEILAGTAITLNHNPGFSQEMGRGERWPRIDVQGLNGSIGSFLVADHPHVDPFTVEFMGTRADLDQFLETIWEHTRGGHEPIAFMPGDDESVAASGDIFYGKLREVASIRRRIDSHDLWVYSVEFAHLPYHLTV